MTKQNKNKKSNQTSAQSNRSLNIFFVCFVLCKWIDYAKEKSLNNHWKTICINVTFIKKHFHFKKNQKIKQKRKEIKNFMNLNVTRNFTSLHLSRFFLFKKNLFVGYGLRVDERERRKSKCYANEFIHIHNIYFIKKN